MGRETERKGRRIMTAVAILLIVLSLIVRTVVGLILGKEGEEDDGNDQF